MAAMYRCALDVGDPVAYEAKRRLARPRAGPADFPSAALGNSRRSTLDSLGQSSVDSLHGEIVRPPSVQRPRHHHPAPP